MSTKDDLKESALTKLPLSAMARIQAGVRSFLEKRSGELPPGSTAFTRTMADGMIIRYGTEEYSLFPRRDRNEPDDPGLNTVISVEELLALDLPAPEPLVTGFLNRGETILIAGRQKVGKSRLTQQLALCLANGEPFLGMKAEPTKVLMIDLENRRYFLKQRFVQMAGPRNGDGRLLVWSARSLADALPDSMANGMRMLRGLVDAARPDVLIIDPWRIWLGGDENDAANIVRGLKALASLREIVPDLAIVIVHHVRKERFESPKRLVAEPGGWVDAISGHHALMSHVDSCFGLERDRDENGNPLIVFGGIARNLEPKTLILDEDESLRFSVVSDESSAAMVMTPAERKIWTVCKDLKRFRFQELMQKVEGNNRKAASRALKIAEGHGLLVKDALWYVVAGGS